MSPSKLTAYQAKRDFQKTAEPAGDDPVRPSKRLRFVVQKHDATRLHFDLRLELDGVFKSWAVTRGPSLNPADKRLAVEVEDHPLGYGDFEGIIPKGQYGGGTMQVFDRGYWAPEGPDDPETSLQQGELKFALEGHRLNGSFVLVRMKKDKFGGKRANWLLIKHRDESANDREEGGGILTIDTSVASGRALAAIAAGKGKAPMPFMLRAGRRPAPDAIWDSSKGRARDQRAGRSTSAQEQSPVKAAERAATLPDFVPPQLCRTVARPPSGATWLHEIKFDGYRVQARIERRAVTLRTRTGLDWTAKFGAVAKALAKLPDAILDGEIIALDAEGTPSFSALQAAISAERTEKLVFFAFDLLFVEGRDLRRAPLATRKHELARLIAARKPASPLLRYVEHFKADGASVFASAKDLKLEGIVSKRSTATYRSGRSDTWTKAKCRVGHEVVIGGWTETAGKFRSLLGGVFRDGALTYVGRIGTGYSAGAVAGLLPKLKVNAAAKSPFAAKGAPPRDKTIHWLKPVLVAEVEFADWSADGLVRQAAFKGLRDDKPVKDVVADAPAAAKEAIPTPAKAKAKPGKVSVMGVALSHPEKTLWPDAGDDRPVTKHDLAAYFEAVGPWMLPHLVGRACSIVRAPDGIDGETFFQRHVMAGGSNLFAALRVAGDRDPYLVLNGVAALAGVAQSGGLELHPSNAAPDRPEVPGRLVFDLDPAPDVAFADVVAAAKELRMRLEAVGLAAFCKTTGGKGLHVVTPLASSRRSTTWAEAKQFARDICGTMERDAPRKYLTKMSKAARAGRIFLDYLRNDRLATAVAPLSPRARAHAPVSMPLTWTQVKADLDSARYNVRTVPSLIARGKAWADYEDAGGSLADAIKKLERL